MVKRILVLGASGLIGTYITSYLTESGHTVLGSYFSHFKAGLIKVDVLNVKELTNTLANFKPDCVIFLVGSKDVVKCENQPYFAIDVNVQSVRNYIESCLNLNIKPFTLYFSTDYVFDGLKGAYKPEDMVGAKTVYGMTNILAERLILSKHLPGQIIRVSAVMAKQGGFFKWLMMNLQNEQTFSLFENTYFSPTSIGNLCRYVADIVLDENKLQKIKIVHFNDGYRFSRYQFGCLIAEKVGKRQALIKPERTNLNTTNFQPDISILPNGMSFFKSNDSWNELENIY